MNRYVSQIQLVQFATYDFVNGRNTQMAHSFWGESEIMKHNGLFSLNSSFDVIKQYNSEKEKFPTVYDRHVDLTRGLTKTVIFCQNM